MPYAHASGEIRCFRIATIGEATFVITAAADGLIRTWRFDNTQGKFEALGVLEGHLRGVTSILLQGNNNYHIFFVLFIVKFYYIIIYYYFIINIIIR